MNKSTRMSFTVLACVAGCGILALGAFAADRPQTSYSPELTELLARFDRVQDSIRTLRAELTMTTNSRLLKDPVVYRGHVYMTKPDSVRWEFDTPEEMKFVINDDQYLGYYPAQKRAERKNIKRWSDHLFRYIGLGQASGELEKFYDIDLTDPGADMPGTHCLLLEPKKRRARKRVEDVRFWVSTESLLPVRVEYRNVDGNSRIVEFRGMKLNVDIASSLYTVELPADVQVTTGFTPFGGGGS